MILIIVTVTPLWLRLRRLRRLLLLLLLLLLLRRRVVVDASITAAAEVAGHVAALVGVVDAVDVRQLLFGFAYHTLALCFGQQSLLL